MSLSYFRETRKSYHIEGYWSSGPIFEENVLQFKVEVSCWYCTACSIVDAVFKKICLLCALSKRFVNQGFE